MQKTPRMQSVTLDGIQYAVTGFSAGVQEAVAIYERFSDDLNTHQYEIIKLNAAMQHLMANINRAVTEEIAAARTPATSGEKPAA